MDHLYFFIYLLLELSHSLLSLAPLPVGCTACSHAPDINTSKIYTFFVLYILLDTYNKKFNQESKYI